MSSYFTIPGAQKKRKRPSAPEPPKKRFATTKPTSARGATTTPNPEKAPPKRQKRPEREDSVSGSDSESDSFAGLSDHNAGSSDEEDSEHENETAAERRLRLAERYLSTVREEVDEHGFDAADIDRDIIAERLKEDVAESKGKVWRDLASTLDFGGASVCHFRWNSGNVNAVATCAPHAYTVTKDMYLTKWRIQELPRDQYPQTTRQPSKKAPAPPRRRPEKVRYRTGNSKKGRDKNYRGHTGAILCVAASQDGQFVVTGGEDGRLIVHDANTLQPVRVWMHHRDAVTGIVFRRGGATNQLYSCSRDRTVKSWDLGSMAYVETLYGHQDCVADISALAAERALTCGSRDRTARVWKIAEESQLVFRGGTSAKHAPPPGVDAKSLASEGSMDRVAMLDDELFVTGSDNGAIGLWSIARKKPLFVWPRAHGIEPQLPLTVTSAEEHPDPAVVPPPQPRWITALKAVPYTNLVLSGSWDGCVRVWRLSEDKKRLESVGVLGGDPEASKEEDVVTNGESANGETNGNAHQDTDSTGGGKAIRGVVNDISFFERGDRGVDGMCVVVGVGKEHRMGQWQKVPGGRNGAVIFEVPRISKSRKGDEDALTNGVGHDA